MGVVKKITHTSFPTQSDWVGKDTKVTFHYDTAKTIRGTIVRDDKEEPWVTIIRVEGRYILGTECQHTGAI